MRSLHAAARFSIMYTALMIPFGMILEKPFDPSYEALKFCVLFLVTFAISLRWGWFQ